MLQIVPYVVHLYNADTAIICHVRGMLVYLPLYCLYYCQLLWIISISPAIEHNKYYRTGLEAHTRMISLIISVLGYIQTIIRTLSKVNH